MLYTVKIIDLDPWEIKYLKQDLGFYTRHGIKITFLKKVVYIHCDSDHPYQGLLNIMHGYVRSDRLVCNQKTKEWLSGYFPFRLTFK